MRRYACALTKKAYPFGTLPPPLSGHITDLLLRKGKRIRPVLFVTGYLGYAGTVAPGLYTSAISVELLHDFILVHDDIIDRSDFRRGKPSMHSMLDKHLARYKHVKFSGQDLAIILGDVIYALGISAFLTIGEDPRRKELALRKLVDAAVCTGSGEFLELLSGTKDIGMMAKKEIYKIYDLKTGIYSFATPLVIGAMLAGAKNEELKRLFACGIYLGRAFQVKNDLADILEKDASHGGPALNDLREAKRTILIWYAYNNSDKQKRSALKNILEKNDPSHSDLLKARNVILDSGAVTYAQRDIGRFVKRAKALYAGLRMRRSYKSVLSDFSDELLSA